MSMATEHGTPRRRCRGRGRGAYGRKPAAAPAAKPAATPNAGSISMPPDIGAIIDVLDIKRALRVVTAGAKAARNAGDLDALRAALTRRRYIERRGGELILAGASGDVHEMRIKRWTSYAKQSPDEFMAQVRRNAAHVTVAAAAPGCMVRMISTPWSRDEFGNLCREVTNIA